MMKQRSTMKDKIIMEKIGRDNKQLLQWISWERGIVDCMTILLISATIKPVCTPFVANKDQLVWDLDSDSCGGESSL
jgi:hypothetical protein